MSSIYARGHRIWARLKQDGRWIARRTPYAVGQEEDATRYAAAAQRILDDQAPATGDAPAVRQYLARWTAERAAAGVRTAREDAARLERHAMPRIGDLRIDAVRPSHARDLVRALRASGLAPRTQLHVFRALRTMFENARIDELITENPIAVKPRELPKKRDADPEWRGAATYATPEVERLISYATVPHARRVQYALKAIAGLRHGEVAALRWRNYERAVEPLGRLSIAWAYCSRTHTIKPTKTEETRAVPVHPTLARVLAEWRLAWPTVYGRQPDPDDLVVPTRAGLSVKAAAAVKVFKADLARLGLRVRAGASRDRGGHDLRSWYLTQAIQDGADPVLLRRTTHAAPKDVAGGYERYGWPAICREVAKLRVRVLDERAAKPCYMLATGGVTMDDDSTISATPTGFEPVILDARARSNTRDQRLAAVTAEQERSQAVARRVTGCDLALAAMAAEERR